MTRGFGLVVLLGCLVLGAACAPIAATRVSDPAEPIGENKARELQLLGTWQLDQLLNGATPAPNEKRTLTFLNDGTLKMDLWEHQLTYKYEIAPDPETLHLTWVSSTNPNDKPGETLDQSLDVQDDQLLLDGDRYHRTAMADGATLTPPAKAQAQETPRVTPSSGDMVSAELDQPVSLRIQQTAMLTDSPDKFGITFYGVKQDSRCPQGVTCIQAGEVRVWITFQENGLLHPPVFELTTRPNSPEQSVKIEDYLVTLLDVQPPKQADVEIAPEDYIATFRISKADSAPPLPTWTAQPPMSTPVAQATGTLGQPITLKMFETFEFPDAMLRVTMNGVLEDSRCPSKVNCVQAGRALLSFVLEHEQQLGYMQLSTQPPDGRTKAYFQGYSIELQDVKPYPETPDQKIPTTAYSATVIVREEEPPTSVNKNQPLVLKPGQTGTIADENAKVTFVGVESDSRCPYNVSCFVRGNAPVEVTLTQADGTTQTFVLNTDESKENSRTPDTGDYAIELVALNPYPRVDIPGQDIKPDEYEATLVVRKFAPGTFPTRTPSTQASCLGIGKPDAEAILGEKVQAEPLAKVNIRAVAFDDESKRASNGLCGYVTTEETMKDVMVVGEPMFAEAMGLYAVTAGRLEGADALELLRIANIVRGSKQDGDTNPYLLLLTRLTAGDWEGAFETLQEIPHDPDAVHFESVDSYGDEGLWVWRTGTLNNYAALLVRDKDAFVVMEALLPKTMTEAAAKEAIHSAMEKNIQ